MQRIKHLPQGVLRLFLVFSILIPLISMILVIQSEDEDQKAVMSFMAFFGFLIFWLLVRIILWVTDGFKEDRKDK